MPEGTTAAPWSGRAFLKVAGVTPPAAPEKLLSKEISDIIHHNKTKDREFDIVKQLKKSGHDGVCGSNAISLKQYENNPEAAQKFNKVTKDAFENGSYAAVKTGFYHGSCNDHGGNWCCPQEHIDAGGKCWWCQGGPSSPNPGNYQGLCLEHPNMGTGMAHTSLEACFEECWEGLLPGQTTAPPGTTAPPEPTEQICLGIIFHQLTGANSPSQIDEAYCRQIISQTNNALAGQNPYPIWSSVVGDSKIRLKFEKLNIIIDDRTFCGSGNCLPHDPDETDILLAAPREDPEHFVNIWVAKLDGAAGFATLGGLGSVPDNYDFVCDIQKRDEANPGPAADPNPTNGVSSDDSNTFQHELGHLFGLSHIWGDTAAAQFGGSGHACDDDDGVADTPAQFGPGQGTDGEQTGPCNENTDTCAGGGRDMYENIMGYPTSMCDVAEWKAIFDQGSIFTVGQGDRMRASILSSPYIDTLNSSGCEDLTTTSPPTITGCHPCNDCGSATSPVGTTSSPADKWHLYKEWTPDP